ncbi:MAG: MotA/TolQ/ExbB proton channel family protein [Deltaproteobacteria bacterium]|nr:MotA/TolQ/ExbB proton channel family protein [Deltaproteobacteria bacterium]
MQFFFEIFDYFHRGGPLLLPIILISLLMWVLIIQKLRSVWAVNQRDINLGEALGAVRERRLVEDFFGTPLCHVVGHFVEEMTAVRRDNLALLNSLITSETERLGRHINYIYVLASIAPLLGLLGTVQGMIATFDAISIYGTGNPRALANGIAEALITTQSGLFVSIPGLFMAGFLQRRVFRISQRLDEFRAGVMKELGGTLL